MLTILLMTSVFYPGHAVKDYGQDFITAFPENIAYYYPADLTNILKITSLHDNTNFNVIFSGSNIATGTLNAGQTEAVNLPNEVEEHQLGLSSKSVRVTSDKDITVFSISKRANSIQTNIVQPLTNLGAMYQIPFLNFTELISMLNHYNISDEADSSDSSSQTQAYSIFRVLVINAEDKDNMVTITNKQGTNFKLSPFQLIQMEGSPSMMKVSAGAKVSILLTHPCLDTSSCRCTMVLHQLRPANLLTDSFLVPPFYTTNTSRMFSTSDQSIELKYGSPPFNGSLKLDPGSSDFLPFYQPLKNEFSNIAASKPVSLILIDVGSLVDLIPVSLFSACYLVHSTSATQSQVLLIAETAQTSDTYIDSDILGSSLTWSGIKGTTFSWAVVDLHPLMSHVIWHASSKIAVYVIESMPSSVDYGGPAISINEEPDPSGCLISPAVLEVSIQSVSWPESHLYCQQKGGHLASPGWADAHSNMALTLTEIGASGQAWIGLRRSLMTLEWYWQNGQNLSFSNWDNGQPGSPEKGMCAFVKMEPNGSYKWSSTRCCSPMKSLCFNTPALLNLTNPFA